MAKNALPAISDDDIDEDILNDALLQGSKNMPNLSARKADTEKEAVRLAVAKLDPGHQRVTKAISLPQYLWDWIKAEHRAKDEPQNVIIMRMMKQGGAPIREEDLVDGRISRLAHGRRS